MAPALPCPMPLPDPAALSDATLDAFRRRLVAWFRAGHRAMPWRETRDPYAIWVSETMLQQTRVETADGYFRRFMAAFPTATALADAPLDDVLKRWEGLGYYARARNLKRAAEIVARDHGGTVPGTYDAFRALPGVGPYTAAAVLSIAHDRPHAVLDGNVTRVLARVFAVDEVAKQPRVQKRLQAIADALLPIEAPGDFNQGIMELGATVCTPRAPSCPVCPLESVCAARAEGRPEAYPVVAAKAPVPHVEVAVALLRNDAGRLLVQQRPESAMLGGLWELPGGKIEPGETAAAACAREIREELGVEASVGACVAVVGHVYSHLRVTLRAFECRIVSGVPASALALRWASDDDLATLAIPRATHKVFEAMRAARAAPTLFG